MLGRHRDRPPRRAFVGSGRSAGAERRAVLVTARRPEIDVQIDSSATETAASSRKRPSRARCHGTCKAQHRLSSQGRSASTHRPVVGCTFDCLDHRQHRDVGEIDGQRVSTGRTRIGAHPAGPYERSHHLRHEPWRRVDSFGEDRTLDPPRLGECPQRPHGQVALASNLKSHTMRLTPRGAAVVSARTEPLTIRRAEAALGSNLKSHTHRLPKSGPRSL